jgi:DNA repair photolyase
MEMNQKPLRGRSVSSNPPNRFETLSYEPDPDQTDNDRPLPQTQLLKDTSRSLITYNDSPDVGFDASVNPYRGCEHGCIYCYARPTHEYFGFSAGLDFETKILVKGDAPELLRRELSSPRWKPRVLALSGVTDPYQPVEKRLRLTRKCLEVLAEFRNPAVIITKNHLVTRDVDLLKELASHEAAAVFLSITTLDPKLACTMEPRASQPLRRLDAIRTLSQAGIPTGVMVAPTVPGLTDHEMPSIIDRAVRSGATSAGYVMLRLPYRVKELFEEWLTQHSPDRKEKVLNRIRSIRDGKLNDPRFKSRMRGEGIFADQIAALFCTACRKAGIQGRHPNLSTAAFRRPTGGQLSLFE